MHLGISDSRLVGSESCLVLVATVKQRSDARGDQNKKSSLKTDRNDKK